MEDICVLSDLEKVKTISDSLRVEILRLLIRQSLTSKQIADLLKQSSSKIHYHVKELEKQELIQLVDTVEKGGILEKYYRAVAKNYYIDKSLGEFFEENETSSLEALNQDILSWRRYHRLKVDVQALANKIVRTCLRVEKSEVVGILGSVQHMDLVEPLALEIQGVGAYPLLSLNTPTLKHKTIEESTPEMLKQYFRNLGETLKPVTTVIMLEHIVDPFIAKTIDYEKVEAYRQAWSSVRNDLVRRKVKWAFIGYPTHSQADNMELDFIELHDVFWKSLDVDYEELQKSVQYVAELFDKGEKVVIRSQQGTNLELSITGRRAFIDDGVISETDIKNGDTFINLPSGEVYIAPIENSANGTACLDFAYYQGEAITGIELGFRDGQVVSVKAQKNEHKLTQLLETGELGRKILGELGIGLNPWIRKSIGYMVCDTKQLGSIHIALGENRLFGGLNQASIHWPLVMTDIELWVDEVLLLKNGEIID